MLKLPLRILIVDNEAQVRDRASSALTGLGHDVSSASNAKEALRQAAAAALDLAVVDMQLGQETGLELMPRLLAANPAMHVVLTSTTPSISGAVRAIQMGAADYVEKPLHPEKLMMIARQVEELRDRDRQFLGQRAGKDLSGHTLELFTNSPAMSRTVAVARYMATQRAGIFIQGELGSGKAHLAQAVHGWLPQPKGEFKRISCADMEGQGISMEWLLFDADQSHATLYLESLHKAPPKAQEILLTHIQNTRSRPNPSHCLIASSSVDLKRLAEEERFNRQLFLALQAMQLDLPALRERKEDILLVARGYLNYFGQERSRPPQRFSAEAIHALQGHSWPGNIPELRSAVERAVTLCQGPEVGLIHLPLRVAQTRALEILEAKPAAPVRRKALRA
jgi:NtrC-family two-component system response regulator AlgB